jgi:hypothetical protein
MCGVAAEWAAAAVAAEAIISAARYAALKKDFILFSLLSEVGLPPTIIYLKLYDRAGLSLKFG